MKIIKTKFEGLFIVKQKRNHDRRGFLRETFNNKILKKKFCFEYFTYSKKNVLRGFHFQINKPQSKYVNVLKGKILDCVVDLRKKSKTYGNWFGIYLSDKKKEQLWIPKGFAHGYYVLSDIAEIKYKTTSFYKPEHERILFWQDKNISIKWPLSNSKPIISKKDKQGELFQKINKKKI